MKTAQDHSLPDASAFPVLAEGSVMRAATEQFRDAIRAAGLKPPEVIEPDGKLHRFASNGVRGDDAGWYVFHEDGISAGRFGCWRTGLSQMWRSDIGRKLTADE